MSMSLASDKAARRNPRHTNQVLGWLTMQLHTWWYNHHEVTTSRHAFAVKPDGKTAHILTPVLYWCKDCGELFWRSADYVPPAGEDLYG